jgi:hypothetical protein
MWVFWALLTVFGFVSSLKRMAERLTERYCARRKLRLARAKQKQLQELEKEAAAREQRVAALAAFIEKAAPVDCDAPAPLPGMKAANGRRTGRQPCPGLRARRLSGVSSDLCRVERVVASLRAACARAA